MVICPRDIIKMSFRHGIVLLNGSVDSQDSNISNPVEKRAKEKDKMFEDYDVMQEVMEEEKVVGMEPTVIEEDNESRSERSAAEAAKHLCVVVDDEAEDRRAVSDDEEEAAGDGRGVPDVKEEEEEHEGKEAFVQQPAKQEAVPRISERKVAKKFDFDKYMRSQEISQHISNHILDQKLQRCQEMYDRWIKANKKNCSDGSSDDDSS